MFLAITASCSSPLALRVARHYGFMFLAIRVILVVFHAVLLPRKLARHMWRARSGMCTIACALIETVGIKSSVAV